MKATSFLPSRTAFFISILISTRQFFPALAGLAGLLICDCTFTEETMLVLERKEGQSIIVGGNIEITVCEIHGDHVRLGVTAPKKISVHRREVQEAIDKTTNVIPRASLAPEHKQDATATPAEAMVRNETLGKEVGAGCA